MPPKWFLIAKNQYLIYTSSFRRRRLLFPFLVIGALAAFVWFIAPAIVEYISSVIGVDEFVEFFLSQVAVVSLQILLFTFFFIFVTLPITFTLRDIKTEQQWLFFSAPIKPSDVLLGEFFGELPLYAILITIITGFITAVLNPLGIDIAQKSLIVIIFVITLSCALWIGTVIAALLRTRLGRSARGKDLGKALSVIIILPAVALLYAFMGGNILGTLANPQTSGIIKTVLAFFPSTWGAQVINGFASNPGDIGAMLTETLTRLGGLLTFFVATLWVGTRMADRAYSLEATTFTAAKVKLDGIFYKTIKFIGGGGSFGTLLGSTFKVYTRRLHNISWLVYVVCIAALLYIFILRPDEPFVTLMLSSFVSPMLAAIVASDVTIRGKETLFLYKKIPSGVSVLLKTRLIQGWLTVIPIMTVIMAISIIRTPQVTILPMLVHIGFMILIATAYMLFALGIFLLMPAYTEKGGEFVRNLMIVVQGSIFLFIACLILFGETQGMLLMILLSWLLGMTLLFLGKRHLSRME